MCYIDSYDRDTLGLGASQVQLIESVMAVQPNTVVVVRASGAFTLDMTRLPAVLFQLLPGEQAGHSLASILFGRSVV